MNIKWINREYNNIKLKEDELNYKFEPPCNKTRKNQKRDINYNDLKQDFIDELAAYGFSPFIHRSYASQKNDKDIKKFKVKNFNYGLSNYIKKKYNTRGIPNTNILKDRKNEKDNIEGHYLYKTIYKIEKLKRETDATEEDQNVNKRNKKKSKVLQQSMSLNSFMSINENTKSKGNKQRKVFNNKKGFPCNLSDDNYNTLLTKENKHLLKEKYLYSVKSQKSLHPLLSLSSNNEKKTNNTSLLHTTMLNDYISPKRKEKNIQIIRYPIMMQLYNSESGTSSQLSSTQMLMKVNKIGRFKCSSPYSRSSKKKMLEILEKSPESIFQKAKKIRNKYIE